MNFSDDIKKIFLVGVGALATTGEKSKELIDELVKKGELTVEQGKVINEELKYDAKKKFEEVNPFVKNKTTEDLINDLENISSDELELLRQKLSELEAKGTKVDDEKELEDKIVE